MRLHLGCGNKRLPGFTHVDIRESVNPDIVANVLDLDVIRDNTVALIYFCHGIEHLKYDEAAVALLEWKRVLRPGGKLMLSVPDFDKMIWLYRRRGLDAHVRAMVCGGMEHEHNVHYSIWDEHTLHGFLQSAGYSLIGRYDAYMFLPDDYTDYSVRSLDGVAISLNMEATA